MILPILGLLVVGGVLWATSKKGRSKDSVPMRPITNACSDPTNPPDWVRFQVQQAIASGDPSLMIATAAALEKSGCPAQAANLRDHASAAGKVNQGGFQLVQGERYMASALLSGVECLASAGAVADYFVNLGFRDVEVYTDLPDHWGEEFSPPDGFLECSRYVEGSWGNDSMVFPIPDQIWRVSTTA